MITEIQTLEDVKLFAKQLLDEGLSFHPDDDFNDYVNFSTKDNSYSIQEADLRNKLMDQCFEVCERVGVDIYEIMLSIVLPDSNLDIPDHSNDGENRHADL